MPSSFFKRIRHEVGSGYLEFLIVAPILLLVAGSTIELARFIRFRQIADVVSREAALEAYRRCDITNILATDPADLSSTPQVNITTSTNNIQACLNDVAAKFQATVAVAGLTNAQLILSFYRYDFGSVIPAAAPACTAPNSVFTGISTSAANSVFNTNGTSIRNQNGQDVVAAATGCQLGRILISELAFFYTPIIDFRVIGIGFGTDFNNSPLRRNPGGDFQRAFRETTIL